MKEKTGAIDLTTGNEMRAIVVFALPLIAGNLFQQLYNLMDTMIVGKFIGADALAAVGSSYMTMNFLTSIIIGLCMGSGIVFSWFYGSRQREKLEQSMFQSFLFILAVTVMITGASLLFLDQLLHLLNIESSIFQMTRAYLFIIICGMGFVFLYNYFTAVLRSMGNSFTPLYFFGDFVGDQYRIGLYICSSASDGSIRSSLCHGHRAGSIGSRNCSLYTVEGKRGKYFQADAKRRERIVLYDRESVTFDKRAAVDYEFRYFDGTGFGEQFRRDCHGWFCSCCEN